MNITIVSGSPRQDSLSFAEALFLKNYLQKNTTHQINLIDIRSNNLGLLQQVYANIDMVPEQHKNLAKIMFASDAFIVVTPEYNGGYSPALQNLFDHFPKQYHKAFGIVTASTGALGGMRATQQMFLMVAALFGIASPQLLITPQVDKKFDANGNLLDENFEKNIQLFLKEFLWLAQQLQPNN